MFENLVFEKDDFGEGAVHTFPNGWGVSVIRSTSSHGGSRGLYELAVLRGDEIHYENSVARGDVCGWLAPEQVSELMCQVAEFAPLEDTHV